MLTAENLVSREVHYCVSHLVATMAGGYGSVSRKTSTIELEESCEQAFELCTPIQDYEEAAIQDGWTEDSELSAVDYCHQNDVEPYDREIFEHWIVSDWLADKLAEKGEKVDKDFAGLIVWGRTTTGQGIANDWVIEEITRELNAK